MVGGVQASAADTLEIAHGVVRGIADQTPRERHAGNLGFRLRRLCERGAQGLQQFVLGARPRTQHPADTEAGGRELHLQALAEADEGVAGKAFATLDTLQQESRPERRELHIRRDRRVEIGCDVEWRLHNSWR